MLYSMFGNKAKIPTSTTCIKHCTEVPSQCNKQEKERKAIKIRK